MLGRRTGPSSIVSLARLGSDGAAPDQVRGKLYRSEDCQDDKEHWSELKRGLTLARAECEVTGTVKPWREVCHEMRAHVYKDCRFNGSSSVLPMWVPMLRHGGDPRLWFSEPSVGLRRQPRTLDRSRPNHPGPAAKLRQKEFTIGANQSLTVQALRRTMSDSYGPPGDY